MRLLRASSAIVLAWFACGAAKQEFWHIGRTDSGAPFAMAYDDDETTPLLRLECGNGEVVATAFGATHLLDPESGQEIGDAPGSEMKGSGPRMALITDTVNANWIRTEAAPNPSLGWDLTIRLPFDHPGFVALPHAKMIALATGEGNATAAAVEKGDRTRLAEFVRMCRGGS
jgi:hypothetical protein